jgi:hypothetical protein
MEGLAVGRIVHYTGLGTPAWEGGGVAPVCLAAIVTEVNDPEAGVIGICVLRPTGMSFYQRVEFRHPDTYIEGAWHWPERE